MFSKNLVVSGSVWYTKVFQFYSVRIINGLLLSGPASCPTLQQIFSRVSSGQDCPTLY